jgi:hypothetical protein
MAVTESWGVCCGSWIPPKARSALTPWSGRSCGTRGESRGSLAPWASKARKVPRAIRGHGAKGRRGPTGPQGPKGEPADASAVYASSGHEFLNGANYTVVARLELPAGRYLLIGKGQALNQQQTPDLVSCNVYDSAGHNLDSSTVTVPTASYGTLAFQRPVDLLQPQSIRLECIDGNGTAGIGTFIRLSAVSAGTIIEQG